jgi:sulfate adenylyltransferase
LLVDEIGNNLGIRDALTAELARAQSLPKITCSSREEGDIVMLGIGGFNPLDGFMGKADWEGVCDNMTMTNGLFGD